MPGNRKRYVVYVLKDGAWMRTVGVYVSRREAYAKANALLPIYGRTKVEDL